MKNKIFIIVIIIIFVIALIILNLYMNNSKGNTQSINIPNVTNENFESEVLKSDKLVLVDFYADWCEPCKIFSPILENISEEYDNVKVVKVNVDEEVELSQHYGISSLPTLIIIRNGKVFNRSIGVISELAIKNMIKQLY